MRKHILYKYCWCLAAGLAVTATVSLAGRDKAGPLGIAVHPEDQTTNEGGVVTFTVVPDFDEEPEKLEFQWLYNDHEILKKDNPSAESNVLSFKASRYNVGFYRCLIRHKRHPKYHISSDSAALFLNGEYSERDGLDVNRKPKKSVTTSAVGPFQPSSGTKSCIGPYVGYTKFKTNTTQWFTPYPSNTTCTIANMTAGQTLKVEIIESPTLRSTCYWQTVSLILSNIPGRKYAFTCYSTNTSGLTNGQPLSLSIQWDP